TSESVETGETAETSEVVETGETAESSEVVETGKTAESSEVVETGENVETAENVLFEIFPKLADLPNLAWLQDIPINYAALLYYAHIAEPPKVAENADNAPVNKANLVYIAINTLDFFVIHAKACTCEIFGAVVRKLLGESENFNPPEITFEQYKKKLTFLNRPTFAILDKISDITTEMEKYATTYFGTVASINEIYFAAIEYLTNDELRNMTTLITALRVAGAKQSYITKADKTAVVRMFDKITPILRKRIEEEYQRNNPKMYQSLEEMTPQSMHSQLRPLDGTRAFLHNNIAVIDLDACDEIPVAEKYVIIGDKSAKFELFAKAAKTQKDGFNRFAEIGTDKSLKFKRLNKNNIQAHIMTTSQQGNKIGILTATNARKIKEIEEIANLELENLQIGNISNLYRHNFDVIYLTHEHEKLLNIANAKAKKSLFVLG
ncbi:MAG: hypothetical protein FWG64_13215, partial [Firmicutes bacterium]|nr:hypothetical protein [Bacillota bacterium]